jgi:hypothetical protein
MACAGAVSGSYYVHLADTHLDLGYAEGAAAECERARAGLPCCHKSDQGNGTAPRYGHPKCDAPAALVTALVEGAAKLWPQPEYVLLGGDLVDHNFLVDTPTRIRQAWAWHLGELRRVWPGVPVYPTIGNHDVFPAEMLSASGDVQQLRDLADLLDAQGVLADPVAKATMAKYGNYAVSHSPRLRIVAVNSMYAFAPNILLNKTDPDPAAQNAWLESVVAEAERAGAKVVVNGHVPPVVGLATDRFVESWASIVAKHRGVIVKAGFGHQHTDQLTLCRQGYGDKAVGWSSVAPGGSPFNGIWPGIRIVEFNPQTLEDVDWHQYNVNISKANAEGYVTLEKLYSARSAFDIPDLSLGSIEALVEKLRTEEATASLYLKYQTTKGSEPRRPCNDQCRKQLYCNTAYTNQRLRTECLQH